MTYNEYNYDTVYCYIKHLLTEIIFVYIYINKKIDDDAAISKRACCLPHSRCVESV